MKTIIGIPAPTSNRNRWGIKTKVKAVLIKDKPVGFFQSQMCHVFRFAAEATIEFTEMMFRRKARQELG